MELEQIVDRNELAQWARTVRRPAIELAVGAGISTGMACGLLNGKYRRGLAPESPFIRENICRFVNINESVLFPLRAITEDQAS
jgi:hypothetical protein